MKLKNIVCTLEQAKKLNEILDDHAPESYLAWSYAGAEDGWIVESFQRAESAIRAKLGEDYYRAYTGDELGALLPSRFIHNQKTYSLVCAKEMAGIKNDTYWWTQYEHINDASDCLYCADSKYAAHAKADLAIQGLEEGWIKAEDFRYE